MSRSYSVYILASRSRTLYTGVTNNLHRRLAEHRMKLAPGFTSRYKIFRLVHYEVFADIRLAITRENEIKAWRREKKIRLIESKNLMWDDLSTGWFENLQKRKTSAATAEHTADRKKADPSRRSKIRPGSGRQCKCDK